MLNVIYFHGELFFPMVVLSMVNTQIVTANDTHYNMDTLNVCLCFYGVQNELYYFLCTVQTAVQVHILSLFYTDHFFYLSTIFSLLRVLSKSTVDS